MVTIVDFLKRENVDGVQFNLLILQGGLELVKSEKTGNYYATVKTATISSTLTDADCQKLIGSQLPGSICREECEPYEVLDNKTGKFITVHHRWVYSRDGATIEESVVADSKVAMPV